jgi:AcrR family transcriptional regulator
MLLMGRGADTREVILDHALSLASTVGLEQLTIGGLASAVGLSKSGLFAHFNSKEQLQIDVLGEASRRFVALVVVPALREPRGEPRVQAMFSNWLGWADHLPGGCIIYAAVSELDDRPGPVREVLVGMQRNWMATIARGAQIAIDEGHFRADLDIPQFVFEFLGFAFSCYHHMRLLDDPDARERAQRAFAALLSRAHTS